MTSNFKARKTAIRALTLARRSAVEPDERRRFSQRLAHVGRTLVEENGFRAVALFTPIRDEPDCLPLAATLAAAGVRTLLPAVVGGSAGALAFRPWRFGEPLISGPLGAIPEPPAARGEHAPDLIFTPCAAFDRSGGRIGYGRGHYDAALSALRSVARVFALAVAFACQEVDEVPLEPHDELLDGVLTERELILFKPIRKGLDAAALHR